MKQITTLLIVFLSNIIIAQENKALIGKWKVIEIFNNDYFYKVENDSIVLSEKMQKRYRNKISQQDYKASIRGDNREVIFEFRNENEFYYFFSEKAISPTFKGTYEIINNLLFLDVTNLANIKIKKEASFYFKDGNLHFTMHLESNNPYNYTLKKL